MTSHRQSFYEHYLGRNRKYEILEKSAASADRYMYRGEAIKIAIVVRTDLNGYSDWARNKSIIDRLDLLDDFFTKSVQLIEKFGGVYYRDEGDCIITLFSQEYFGNCTSTDILQYCKGVTGQSYGKGSLAPKTTVTIGKIAFYQKSHEKATGDWSAEGEPFVMGARMEQAVDSKQRIYFEREDFDSYFSTIGPFATYGNKYYWEPGEESIQVPGLGLAGGWKDISYLEFIPDGKIQH